MKENYIPYKNIFSFGNGLRSVLGLSRESNLKRIRKYLSERSNIEAIDSDFRKIGKDMYIVVDREKVKNPKFNGGQ